MKKVLGIAIGVCVLVACGGAQHEQTKEDAPQTSVESASKKNETIAFNRSTYERVISEGLGSFLQHVQVEPARDEKGAFVGHKVVGFAEGGLLENTFLKVGDVVTAINDKSIETPNETFAMWEELSGQDTLCVSFVRDGKPDKTCRDVEAD